MTAPGRFEFVLMSQFNPLGLPRLIAPKIVNSFQGRCRPRMFSCSTGLLPARHSMRRE